MSPRSRTSHDQKRKAKLAERAARRPPELTPFTGRKYQSDHWVPYVMATETAIYETILRSEYRLANDQVASALRQLIRHLHAGRPAVLGPEEHEVEFDPGREIEFLVWNIRRHWGLLFERVRPATPADLIGILRTLLNSIQAHAWNTGPERGYVHFLVGFLGGIVNAERGRSAEVVDLDQGGAAPLSLATSVLPTVHTPAACRS